MEVPAGTMDSAPVGQSTSSQNGGGVGGGRHGTLDEPVTETIMRDLRGIGKKLWYVMLPRARTEAGAGLKEWDLWGPLFLCLALSIVLWFQAKHQQEVVFSLVYVIVWVGACVVTANALLLGGKISFFQSVCVLGYCIFPLDIAALACAFTPSSLSLLKIVFVVVGFTWATGASVGFMSELVPADRKALAVYPVWLFYVSISWVILLI
uniref:Protein YIPF n=1 Tax=Chromera velia CCMP2878 TaxID=1169474 RepID=A0A0G4HP91_9ALVE|mmetsp:Transcript_20584/g.41139  ORF Transcript_20584/g.41139 Transcript_20584/m.41139 type:complete len:208 (-) Transcript_20584:191-814(-)|eukprot:Cvel_29732.t1-p1 / transcript=Cvel_29732.t1 / gene=Cvel_29732 / organism=Chromera_velia_CCMP2878 / gene_product=Protein YIPF6 homolog, putative / transcript_product=Protein YIPF6 homolog, putative / location=Cvel_scaffold4126:1216-4725(-) / protein_length=207 / sequence_SO=supercontig / SO=protein_coding / is_pseudo=false